MRKKGANIKLLLVFLGLIALLFFVIYKNITYKKLVVEAGKEVTAEDFYKKNGSGARFTSKSEDFDIHEPGTYKVYVKKGLFAHKCKLVIEDTIAPTANGKTHNIYLDATCEAIDTVSDIKDATKVTASFVTQPTFGVPGTQDVTVCLTDESGNTSNIATQICIIPVYSKVTVEAGGDIPPASLFVPDGVNAEIVSTDLNTSSSKPQKVRLKIGEYVYESNLEVVDSTPPVISSPINIYYFIGDSISYRNNVTVTDNCGDDIDISIDDSRVDLNTVGTYQVVINATDASGNTSSKTVDVVVAEKTYDVDKVYELADEVLSEIISDDMSDKDKLWAIYSYVINNIGYIDHSEKIDWVQGAYEGLVNRAGDCYVYACTAKVLLDRAGIVNMDIAKIPTDTRHYWNLVDIGEGWRHFDTTPRVDGPTIFYWDDATMMEYSVNHDNSHNYDHNAYPDIP